jgi:hypothetical protein
MCKLQALRQMTVSHAIRFYSEGIALFDKHFPQLQSQLGTATKSEISESGDSSSELSDSSSDDDEAPKQIASADVPASNNKRVASQALLDATSDAKVV